jgi:DNA replication protein DnaC
MVFGLNPHLRTPSPGGCPHGECDGSGFVLDEHSDEARPCSCRAARIAAAKSRSLSRAIPERFQHVAFDRHPVTEMEPMIVREVRRYCDALDERLEEGRGLFFFGSTGTGKTTLAMLVAQQAMRRTRTVAIYDAPQLLRRIHSTYTTGSTLEFMDSVEAVELLVLDDMAVAAQNEWVLEQFYSVINRRYEARRAIVVTADVESPDMLDDHIGRRATSRLLETCLPVPLFGDDQRRKAREDMRRAG